MYENDVLFGSDQIAVYPKFEPRRYNNNLHMMNTRVMRYPESINGDLMLPNLAINGTLKNMTKMENGEGCIGCAYKSSVSGGEVAKYVHKRDCPCSECVKPDVIANDILAKSEKIQNENRDMQNMIQDLRRNNELMLILLIVIIIIIVPKNYTGIQMPELTLPFMDERKK